MLYYVSATVNPILYNSMSKKYRQAFKDTICNCCCPKTRRASSCTGYALASANGRERTHVGAGTTYMPLRKKEQLTDTSALVFRANHAHFESPPPGPASKSATPGGVWRREADRPRCTAGGEAQEEVSLQQQQTQPLLSATDNTKPATPASRDAISEVHTNREDSVPRQKDTPPPSTPSQKPISKQLVPPSAPIDQPRVAFVKATPRKKANGTVGYCVPDATNCSGSTTVLEQESSL